MAGDMDICINCYHRHAPIASIPTDGSFVHMTHALTTCMTIVMCWDI